MQSIRFAVDRAEGSSDSWRRRCRWEKPSFSSHAWGQCRVGWYSIYCGEGVRVTKERKSKVGCPVIESTFVLQAFVSWMSNITLCDSIIESGFDSVVRTTIFTGRPLRALSTPYILQWENERQNEIKALLSRGIIPIEHDLERLHEQGKLTDELEDQATLRFVSQNDLGLVLTTFRPMGIVAGLVTKADQPAGVIVREIIDEATNLLESAGHFVKVSARL